MDGFPIHSSHLTGQLIIRSNCKAAVCYFSTARGMGRAILREGSFVHWVHVRKSFRVRICGYWMLERDKSWEGCSFLLPEYPQSVAG